MVYVDASSKFSVTRNRRLIFLVVAVVVATLVADITLLRIYSYSSSNPSLSEGRIVIFEIIVIVSIVAQYIILEFVKSESGEIRNKGQLHLKLIHRIVTIVQYVLAATIVFIILEMILTSAYSTIAVTIAVGISYSLSIAMLGLLAQRFYLWFKSNKNTVVLLYGLSSSILAVNATLTFGFVGAVLLNSLAYLHSFAGAAFSPFIAPGSLADILYSPYVISTILSFMITWVATIVMLRHYSPKLKKTKYWVVLILPLVYFLLQYLQPFQDMVTSLPQTEYVFFTYTLIFTFSKPVGGILFGIAFWVIARTLGQTSPVRNYMIISAYGLLLLFISNQAVVLVNLTYPPFGLVTVSFMGLSSYLLLLGVYSSAISVSEDSKLRQSIRQVALREPRLLDSIGTAQMEQAIRNRVLAVTKKTQELMSEETGVQSSLSEDDMKQYLEQVIREVKTQKISRTKDGSA
jgi:uncharacterized membrane protein